MMSEALRRRLFARAAEHWEREHAGTDELSRIASAYSSLKRQHAAAWDDLCRIDDSGDCGPLLSRALAREEVEFWKQSGVSPDLFAILVERRTSPRWTYFAFG
jgi:hypothetical protein